MEKARRYFTEAIKIRAEAAEEDISVRIWLLDYSDFGGVALMYSSTEEALKANMQKIERHLGFLQRLVNVTKDILSEACETSDNKD